MAVTNPCCCGCSLQTGTKAVAIVNIVFSGIFCAILLLGVLGFGVIAASDSARDTDSIRREGPDPTEVKILLIATCIGLAVSAFQLSTSIVLLIGASQRHLGKCRFWYIVTMVFFVLFIVKSAGEIVMAGMGGGASAAAASLFGFLVGFVIEGYQLWVVYNFIEELKEGGPNDTVVAGYVHGPAGQPGYVYTKPAEPGYPPPYGYGQGQEGYVAVPLGYPQGPGQAAGGFGYPKLDAEKGSNY